MNANQERIKHLYNRAGFGMRIEDWQSLKNQSWKWVLKQILKDAEQNETLTVGELKAPSPVERKMMNKEERRELAKTNRIFIKDLNIAWYKRMMFTEAQLREKMTLFWHDHFACRLLFYGFAEKQNNTFRNYGLGKFGDLLEAVAKDPGMLQFLNGQQNKKAHPNENFARELLELFTLGRGHYTERDIQEAARAFTGWGFDFNRQFVFRRRQHDTGLKTFLGRTGNFDGDDILRIILEEKQTARFLTYKLYRYFVNDKVNETVANQWAEKLYESDYDIGQLLITMFSSEHFYAKENVGTKIKSPTEFLVGLMRQTNMDFKTADGIIFLQKVLGQMLFQPPGVAGWPAGRDWIDSSTLIVRLRIPQVLFNAEDLGVEVKGEFAGNEDLLRLKKKNKALEMLIDWEPLTREMERQNDAFGWLQAFLLAGNPYRLKEVTPFIRGSEKQDQFKQLTLRLLSTPEYQMC
ncbi:MAG: DUF1800 domain-containing protein [Bacteroidota bacterium]